MIKRLFLCLMAASPLWGEPLTIVTEKDTHPFEVELAVTPEETERGLMFRSHLEPNGGMIFLMDPNYPTAMWMHNAPLSLDMIFLDETGTILHIQENTTPFSKKIIGPIAYTKAVLEVLGGTCQKKNIKVGDTVKFEWF